MWKGSAARTEVQAHGQSMSTAHFACIVWSELLATCDAPDVKLAASGFHREATRASSRLGVTDAPLGRLETSARDASQLGSVAPPSTLSAVEAPHLC